MCAKHARGSRPRFGPLSFRHRDLRVFIRLTWCPHIRRQDRLSIFSWSTNKEMIRKLGMARGALAASFHGTRMARHGLHVFLGLQIELATWRAEFGQLSSSSFHTLRASCHSNQEKIYHLSYPEVFELTRSSIFGPAPNLSRRM
jgi:hypothetical protein